MIFGKLQKLSRNNTGVEAPITEEGKAVDQPDELPASKSSEIKSEQRPLFGLKQFEATAFQGPIPPPELLEQYDRIIPNGADRILTMAEQQQAHRQSIERTVVESGARRANLGLILGFILTLVFGLGSMFLISSGRDISGLVLFSGSLVGLIGVFIYQTKKRRNERLSRSRTRGEKALAKKEEP